jgi:hypothetical protein
MLAWTGPGGDAGVGSLGVDREKQIVRRHALRTHVTVATLAAFVALFALSATAAGIEGYVLEQEIITRSPRADGTLREVVERKTVYLTSDRARLENEYGEALIVRLDRREVIEIDDVMENYQRKTFDKLKAQWKSINAQLLEQVEETPPARVADRADIIDQFTNGEEKWRLIWDLPEGPERERMVRKYCLPDAPPEVEVSVTDEKKKILGRECVRYEAAEDDVVTDSAWIAVKLHFDARYYEFMELWGWLGKALAEALPEVKGLPLVTSMRLRTGAEIEVRTKSIREEKLDELLFEVPGKYVERKRKSAFK